MTCRTLLALSLLLVACDGADASDAGPADAGASDAGPPDAGAPPDFCVEASAEALQDVTGTPAGPYFVHHPAEPAQQTVLFMPGGPGTRGLAMTTYDLFLSAPTTPDDVRVVMPYSETDLPSEAERAIDVLDEVIACYGVDPDRVHLGGTSLGGIAAFGLMLEHGDRFQTLTGVPGAFSTGLPEEWAAALDGKALFLGYGENDAEPWPSSLEDVHAEMTMRGVDSRLEVFAGQGHIPDAAFDETLFFDFWREAR